MGKLTYFPLHGRGEATRMLLNFAKVDFENEILPFAEWKYRKSEFPAGQVPVWTDEEGNMYNQSVSIVNALARQHGFSPKGFHGEWANSWVSETLADFWHKDGDL